MELFFKDLGAKVEKAIKKDVKKIMKQIGKEKIYAVALVTDSDCITLYLALNTYEYLRKADEEYIEMFHDDLSEEDITNYQKGIISLTKWTPDEWGYSDGNNSKLNKVSKILYEKENENPQKYASCVGLFLETITRALKNVIEEKSFGKDSEEITYFISMSDDERTPQIENYSAKLLNSESVYEDFLNRVEL